MRRLKWYEIGLLVVSTVILACGALALVALFVGFNGVGKPITSIGQLSPDVPIAFPADAVILQGEYHSGLGAYMIAKVRFPRSEVHPFLSQPLLLANGVGTSTRSELMDWGPSTPQVRRFHWQLRSIHTFWAIDNVECRPNDPNSQAFVLIDLDKSAYVDVYLDREYH